ncbi:MAG: RluA family pseudouridine synthase [Myxococcota bacterium]
MRYVEVELVVESSYDGLRLDRYLCAKLGKLSRNRVQRIIERDLVAPPLKAASIVRTGTRVRLRRLAADEPETPRTFTTLFLDDELLVIDKPAGLPVHPSASYHLGTVVGRIRERYGDDFAAAVHRLDRETSGVLVAARTPEALRRVSAQFVNGEVTKTYHAIVHGHPRDDVFVIDAPIAMGSELVRIGVRIDAGVGRPSRTTVRVLRRFEAQGLALALVEATPHTGRQHQIRVHMAHVGHGLVGDKIYPDGAIYDRFTKHAMTDDDRRTLLLDRHALHASSLTLRKPSTGESMTFTAPLPEELGVLLGERAAKTA